MNTDQKTMKTLLEDPNCLILDTETTGITNARIIELSVIDMGGNTLYSQMFNPGFSLDPVITQLTGITDAMLATMPHFADEIAKIDAIIGGKTIVCWNASFDIRQLEEEYAKCPAYRFMSKGVDAMAIYARGMGLKMNRYGNYARKLVYAKADLGIGDSQEHRSLSDCLDTLAVMKAFVNLINPDPSMCPDYKKVPMKPVAVETKKTLTFIDAVKAALEGKRMTNGVYTNGEYEELTIIMGCPFMLIQRPGQANSGSRLTKTPTTDDVVSTEWREM